MESTGQGAYVSLALGFVLAGSSVLPGKQLCALPVFLISAAGAAIALAALIPFAAKETRPERGAMRRALPLLCAQAFFGMALFRALMLFALRLASAGEVGMATSATPAFTALFAAFFLREKITPRKAAGVALSICGIALIESKGIRTRSGTLAADGQRLLGLALALGAAASESVFNVLAKKLHASIGPKRASAAVTAIALAMLCVFSVATGEKVDPSALGPTTCAALAYQGLFASALAYICFYRGAARLPASTVGAFSSLIPLAGLLLPVLFLGESFGVLGAVGAAIALAGMLVCALTDKR